MKKAKYNEVPKAYRKDSKKEFAKVLSVIGICAIAALFMLVMFWIA